MLSIRERNAALQRTAPSIFTKVVNPAAHHPSALEARIESGSHAKHDAGDVFSFPAPSPLALTALRLDRASAGLRDVCANDMALLAKVEALVVDSNDLGRGRLLQRTGDGNSFALAQAPCVSTGLASVSGAPGAAFLGLSLLPCLTELSIAGAYCCF
jgi:hypothetical protein